MDNPSVTVFDDTRVTWFEVAFGRLEDGKFENAETFPIDSINSLDIYSSIYEFFPYIEIQLQDLFGNFIIKYPKDGHTFIRIEVEDDEGNNIRHYFLLNKTSLITDISSSESISIQHPFYFISGISVNTIKINNFFPYSTGDNKLPWTNIFENMSETYLDKIFVKNEELIHTQNIGNFISTTNNTMYNDLNLFVSLSHSPTEGLYYSAYNLVDQEFKLYSLNQEYKKEPEDYNGVVIGTIDGNVQYREAQARNVVFENLLPTFDLLNYLKPVKQFEFDSSRRNWKTQIFNWETWFSQFVDVLELKDTPIIKEFDEYSHKSPDEQALGNIIELRKKLTLMTERTADLFKFSNMLQFSQIGYLKRNVGETYAVGTYSVEEHENKRKNFYDGKWFTVGLVNSFKAATGTHEFSQKLTMIKFDSIENF